MPSKKYYAVSQGREGPKIYATWSECSKAVTGFPNAVFKGFSTMEEATKFIGKDLEVSGNIKKESTDMVSEVKENLGVPEKLELVHYKIKIEDSQLNPGKILSGIDVSEMLKNFNEINERDEIDIYTDGSCTSVGTDEAIACSGCYFPQFNVGLSVGVPGNQTNNRGELWAVLYSIYFVMHLIHLIQSKMDNENENSVKMKKMNIHTDSTYVKNNLVNKNKLNLDLCNLFKATHQSNKIPFELLKVPGHADNEGNNMADYLARTVHIL